MTDPTTSSDNVPISLPKGSWLVIFEYLARSYEVWASAGKPEDDTFILQKPDAGERLALWHLEGAIERTLPEIFADSYNALISQEKERLVSRSIPPRQS